MVENVLQLSCLFKSCFIFIEFYMPHHITNDTNIKNSNALKMLNFLWISQVMPICYSLLIAQRDRVFLWSPVCFALGIAAYFSLRFEPD